MTETWVIEITAHGSRSRASRYDGAWFFESREAVVQYVAHMMEKSGRFEYNIKRLEVSAFVQYVTHMMEKSGRFEYNINEVSA